MTDEDDPTAIGRYDWERLVKRAHMNPSAKLVALTIATYSDRSGTRMYPGIEKLAAVTGLTDKTVRAALKTLRDDLRLLERTFDGSKNGRRGLADEYRLRRPHDLDRRTHMLDVGESTASKECSGDCRHPETPVTSSGVRRSKTPPDDPEHRNSVPGTPVMSSGTPELSSPITGNEFPPSSPDHPRNHLIDQREDQVRELSTEGGDELLAKLIQIDEEYARRRGA